MALNKTTNFKLKIIAKTKDSSISATGLPVVQKLKTKAKSYPKGSRNISNGLMIKSNTTSISSSVANSGTSSETTTLSISSIIPYNKKVTIATIAISADSNFKISNSPLISISSEINNVDIFLKETSTANTYNLVCKTNRRIIRNLIANLVYSTTKITTVSNTISRVLFKSSIIPRQGQTKELKIYGSPNTPFNLFVLDENDNSILNSSNSKSITPAGIKNCFSSNLSSLGYFSYKQKFPRAKTILSTTITPSVTSQTRVVFNSLSGVQVGDEIKILDSRNKPFSDNVIKVLTINPTGGNANQCDLSTAITAVNNKPVTFVRSSSYKLHLTTSGTLSSLINQGYPTFTLNQYLNPVLSIVTSTSVGTVRINSTASSITNSISGVKNTNARFKLVITDTRGVALNLKSSQPSKAQFVTASGDTSFSVSDIRTTGDGTTTLNIFFEIIIATWGVQDTVVNFNLDNVIT
jgi:hypothetical protein